MILLNKVDLAPKEFLPTVHNVIRKVNHHAAIIEASHAEVDRRYLFDTARFELTDDIEKEIIEHESQGHIHDSSITSFLYTTEYVFDTQKLAVFLGGLEQDIFRVKGFIFLEGYTERFLLQKAGARLVTEVDKSGFVDPQRKTKIVFIGKNMDQALLWKRTDECTNKPASVLFNFQ
jgi:G3E family GTPase